MCYDVQTKNIVVTSIYLDQVAFPFQQEMQNNIVQCWILERFVFNGQHALFLSLISTTVGCVHLDTTKCNWNTQNCHESNILWLDLCRIGAIGEPRNSSNKQMSDVQNLIVVSYISDLK
jgi:hypothetical protein